MTAGDDNRKTCDGAEWVFITRKKRSVPFYLFCVFLDFSYKTIVKKMIFVTFCRAYSNQSHPMEKSRG